MTSDIVAAIDAAVGCHSCGGSLEKSVSDLFCSEHCQQAWHAKRVATVSAPTQPSSSFATPMDYRAAVEGAVDQLARMHGVPREMLGPIGPVVVRDPSGYLAHFEIHADGRIVDNTERIRQRGNGNDSL